jgi:CMP-N,N'-diacetyllegionaminic acid synthase
VALVPARAGSERVPGKNIRPLGGHPLIAYSIAAARQSGCFDAVVVSTDAKEIADVAVRYGAEVPALRPAEHAGHRSPDVDWIRHMLGVLGDARRRFDLFATVRPTSPFRTAATIRRAFAQFATTAADSLRAVQPVREHPAKMWTVEGGLLRPLLPQPGGGTPLFARQYGDLPPVLVQNSSLELAWTRVLDEHGNVAGERILPFLTEGDEGFTVDYEDDWLLAELKVVRNTAALPDPGVEAGR